MRVRSLVLVAVLASFGVACDQVLDEASLERTLAQQAEEWLEEDDLTVDCPADVPVEDGGVFTCDVTSADGAVGTLEVTQTNDDGHVRWRIVDAVADDAVGGGTDDAATDTEG
jgi:hypothetical protein